eukprot:CAMPEP_0177318606 /NCGR_PEP_ID=MMETSP0368-20130122/14165_1 /TAXON_ID=447022 ORGANISM="Scrippsiella hangoei-like, Strain SHHI-4" /NCGR_SAMPLE_ID=MMETSP0368 /ASSEMBLY_ACC=CAM_ASM_000363 /LENGTH=93 /DNA_ID=CAMNT_0018778049 /DNA_START=54 /DNA_END=331 /DNA_ORIENTATION=-
MGFQLKILHATSVWGPGPKKIGIPLPVAPWRHGPQIMHESRRNDSHESHCATSTTLDFEFKVRHATGVWRHGPENKRYSTPWRHGPEIMHKLR